MYLYVVHFKWTLLVYGHVILAKLVCHLFFVCKLNYLFGAHMCYGGVIAPIAVSSINWAVVEYLYWFLMSWVHGVCWWGHSKIHKNDTSKALQCTIGKQGKLRSILLDAFKYTEVILSFVCNNISTPMAPLLCIRLRWDLWSDFLTCAITFQH